MGQDNPKTKATPPRRRQNRRSTTPHNNKSYASENDMAADVQFPVDFGYGTPFTPLKSASNSPAPATLTPNSKPKPRNGNKARPKNVSTSPRPPRQGQNTPPNTGLAKPTSATAFAGATFHASPAPSSLPIPSFLAKAMESPRIKSDTEPASQEPSPPPTDSEAPTPQQLPSASASKQARDESPLDFFFRADREEKERAQRANSANIALANAIGPFSPPNQTQSPHGPNTMPYNPHARRSSIHQSPAAPNSDRQNQANRNLAPNHGNRYGSAQRNSASGISTLELDGTPGRPMGPAFSTPYQDRIRAARSNDRQGSRLSANAPQQATAAERSEALKKFLALGPASPPERPAANNNQQNFPAFNPQNLFGGAAMAQPRQSGSASPAARNGSQPQDILQMEASLRRILKLDSGPGLGQSPTITDARTQ